MPRKNKYEALIDFRGPASTVVGSPWPKFCQIAEYDADVRKTKRGKRVIAFRMQNGIAIYRVVKEIDVGIVFYQCRLLRGTYRAATEAELEGRAISARGRARMAATGMG